MSDNIVSPTSDSANPAPAKKRNVGKIIIYVLVAFIVVVVGVTFFVNSATKAPVKVSNQFLNALQAQDSTTAYDLFSSEAKKAVPADQFDAAIKQVGPILNTSEKMTSKKVNASTGSAATAEVVYEIKGTDSKTYTFTVNLIKESGTWKVLNFESKLK